MNELNHVAIIMDGNGRWGLKKKGSRNYGHLKGLNTVETIIKSSLNQKIPYLTLYTFSTENWKRPDNEINYLFDLIRTHIKKNLKKIIKQGIKINIIGKRKKLPLDIVKSLKLIEKKTVNIINTKSKLPLVSTATTLRLLLQNSDPICLAITGNPGNIIPSEGYIRGQRLQGALFSWALHQSDSNVLLFEKMSIGNAFPLPDETELQLVHFKMFDVLPTPQFVGERKATVKAGHSGLPYWAKASTKATKCLSSEAKNRFTAEDRQLKRPKGYQFVAKLSKKSAWLQYQPTMQIHMRNKLATHDLFSEQEIVEKTYFLADIKFKDIQAAKQFIELFKPIIEGQQPLSIGRGGRAIWVKQAGYLPEVSASKPTQFNALTLSLDSDLIARVVNSNKACPLFNFYTRLSPDCLLDLLGMSFPKWTAHWEFKEFSEEIEIRGFNAATGLQRMPMLAILQGSALYIKPITDEGEVQLKQLVEKLFEVQRLGLGERVTEGFGRFRINFDPLLSNINNV